MDDMTASINVAVGAFEKSGVNGFVAYRYHGSSYAAMIIYTIFGVCEFWNMSNGTVSSRNL